MPRLFSDMARSGRKASGLACGQLAADRDGFLGGGQGVLAAPQPRCSGCRGCSATWRGRGGRRGLVVRRARGRADGFLGGGQGVLAAPQVAVAAAEVVQRRGEVGEEGAGWSCGQLAAELDGFLGRGPGRPGAAPGRCSGCRGCSAPWRGRGGRRGLVVRPARGRAGRLPR